MIDTTSKMTDKTPLGTLLSLVTSYEVLRRYLEIELMRYGATTIRFHVMSALFRNGGEMTPSEIGKWVFREKNSITAVINTLERQGVVRKEPSKHDRRSVNIIITDKGWQEANRLNPIAQEISRQALSSLDKEQTDTLIEIMRTIRNNLLPEITQMATEAANRR
jgi:DNA-binding MarR family transcriptional regulator